MSSEITDIISVMEFAAQHSLRQFVHDDGRTRLALRRDGAPREPVLPAAAGAPAPAPTGAAASADGQADSGIRSVTSPVPGMCHLSPDPASPTFVTEGDRVEEGQTICIIEAMKVMTAVPAPAGGTVARIHVSSDSVVAVGDPLMDIRT